MAVRTQAGLFDVSHMGEILCEGEEGGTVDDLIVYKKSNNYYFIVVNAANKDKDYQWMINHKFGDAVFTDVKYNISFVIYLI